MTAIQARGLRRAQRIHAVHTSRVSNYEILSFVNATPSHARWRYERLRLLGHCARHPDRPDGWIAFEGRRALETTPDDPARAKKTPGKPRLKWIMEVTTEAGQVVEAMPGNRNLMEVLLDRKE